MEDTNARRRGMTLVEIGVVLAILVILSGILVTSQSVGRDQLAMIHDSAIVSGLLYRAKSMTLQRFSATNAASRREVCAFGVHFSAADQQALLFGDVVSSIDPSSPCKARGVYQGNRYYDSADGDIAFPNDGVYTPDPRIRFSLKDGDSVSVNEFDILFIPPDPTPTSTDSIGTAFPFPLEITLALKQGTLSSKISVTESGQIIE